MAETREYTDRERQALENARENLKRAAAMMRQNRHGTFDRGHARRAGKQYGENRDVWDTLGYPTDVDIDFDEYLGRYLRSDVAGAIVDSPAQTTWRRGVEIVEIDEEGNPVEPDGETEFESDVRSLFDQVSAVEKFERVDRVAGIGKYAVYLIGSLRGEDLTDDIREDGIEGVEDIGFLSIFREDHAEIEEVGDDPFDERFELPTTYRVTFSVATDDDSESSRTEPVHHSRVVHVADDPLEDDLYGRPRLQRVYNRLEDLLKLVGSSAEMFWANVGGITHVRADPDAVLADEDSDKTEAEVLEEFAESIVKQLHREQNRVVATKGFDLERVGSGSPDPTGIFEVVVALLSAGSRIPRSVLFGSERGDVAKNQDVQSWLGSIAERQERYAGPKIVAPFIDLMIELEVVSEPSAGADAYRIEWPSLFELDEEQKAEVLSSRATAAKAISDAIMAGGETAVRVIRTLVPELEGALEEELQALAEFIDEEDRETVRELAELARAAWADGNGARTRRGIRNAARVFDARSLEAAELLARSDVGATPGLEVLVGRAIGKDGDGELVFVAESLYSSDPDADPETAEPRRGTLNGPTIYFAVRDGEAEILGDVSTAELDEVAPAYAIADLPSGFEEARPEPTAVS